MRDEGATGMSGSDEFPADGGAAERRAAPSILLVEDDELVRHSTVAMIEALGHVVVAAGDAEAALVLLQMRRFDILMTDINLPGMSGEVLAAEARAIDPELRLVFVTGRGDIRDPNARALDPWVLRKPYDLAALERVLRPVPR